MKFDFKRYIAEGWDFGIKIFGWYLLYMVLASTAGNTLSQIPWIGSLASTFFVGPALGAGIILFVNHKYFNKESDFGLVFKPFKGEGLVQILLLNLYSIILSVVILIPLGISLFNNLPSMSFLTNLQSGDSDLVREAGFAILDFLKSYSVLIVLNFVCLFLVAVFLIYSQFFVVLKSYSAAEGLKASFMFVRRNFIRIFTFLIILMLINISGVLCLFIGVLFTIPVSFAALYLSFKHNFLTENDEVSFVDADILDIE